jgi:shikimate dehydrogenase
MRRVGVSTAAVRPCADLRDALNGARLLVNATPVGGALAPGCLLDHDVDLDPDLFVADLVYRPARTELLVRAEAAGCRVVSGVDVLVEQGARSFELWTGAEAPVAVMRDAAWAAAEGSVAAPKERTCSAS